MNQVNNCLNCGNTFEGNYCPKCGQSIHTHRIDWHYLLHDLQHFLHLDNSLFYTAKQLLIRPGEAIRDFINGKRVPYFGPLATLLTIAGIYILIYHLGNIDPLNILNQMIYLLNDLLYSGNLNFPSWIVDNYAFIELLIFLPMFSIASFIVFYKTQYSLFEHFAINAYLSAQRMLIGVLTFPILLLFKDGLFSNFIQVAISLLELGFTIWAFMTFFKYTNKLRRFGLILLTFLIVFIQLSILMLFF